MSTYSSASKPAAIDIKSKRGLRSFYPTDKGSIQSYQLGHDGRIEFITAQVSTDHLYRGISTTDEWRKWARERGASTDEPGFIISKRLGGSGIDSVNLFPKSPLLDKTSWAADEDKAYKETVDMKKWKKLRFTARFEYPEDDSLRPSEIEYKYELPSGIVLYGKVNNEVLMAKGEEKKEEEKAEEEEEESEYEYEYEDEEEEEKPEEETTVVENSKPQPPEPPEAQEKAKVIEAKVEVPVHPSPAPEPPSTPVSEPIKEEEPKPKKKPEPQAEAPTNFDNDTASKQNETNVNNDSANSAPTPSTKPSNENTTKIASDFIEMLPIVGSLKLVADTVKAVKKGDNQRGLWKGAQCGISLVADFHFVQAFVRHGTIFGEPAVNEIKIRQFIAKSEMNIVVFSACKVGNEVLTFIRRTFFNK